MVLIDNTWKDIAKGNTAFCIFGGPSTEQVNNLYQITKNNFTITVNRNIERIDIRDNIDMFVVSDNILVREYFEDKEFYIHNFNGGKLLQNEANFHYNLIPNLIKGRRNELIGNRSLIKVLASNDFPCYNHNLSTGQIYKYTALEYASQVNNTFVCTEYRNELGNSEPYLSTHNILTEVSYGNNPQQLFPGGNVSSIVLQLLWYMGFDKVIVVGYGDKGTSYGYQHEFIWDEIELAALELHQKIWGNKLKVLHGGELLPNATRAEYSELDGNTDSAHKLFRKLTRKI